MILDDNNPPPPDPERAPVPWEIIESQTPAEHSAAGAMQGGVETMPAQDLGPSRAALPDDLRVPWGWLALLFLFLLYFATYVALLKPVFSLFTEFGISRSEVMASPNVQGFFVIVHQGLLSLAVLASLAAQMRFWYGSPFWRTVGWRPLETHGAPRGRAYLRILAGGFLFSLVIQFSSAAFGTKAKLPIEALFDSQRNAILLMFMAVAIAPVFEETVFRGYIYPVVARSFGVGASIVITGTLFGLLHAVQLWGGWIQIGLMIVVGIVFTYVRSVTRTVVASYLLHLSYNSVPLLFYIIASHGFRQLPVGP
jgi:membrane protease YdiL (CAAX protease family)